jgi:caffeoyl-CoA O-methyltransferase
MSLQDLSYEAITRLIMIVSDEIEAYASEHCAQEPALFAQLRMHTRANREDAQMLIGRIEGSFLRTLVEMIGAKRVLEIGTFTGYSALWLASGLPEEGQVITLDIDPETTQIAQSYWDQSDDGKKINSILGPALETIKSLDGLFDLIFIDADKENYVEYWKASLPLLRSKGLMVVDNVLWSGKALKPDSELAHAVANFNAFVQKDTQTTRTMLSVRDGMLLAVKQ